MISLRGLSLERGGSHLDAIHLEVADGEIYFLLNRLEAASDALFRALAEARRAQAGQVFFDGQPGPLPGRPAPVTCIDRIRDNADFETEARLGDWIDFLCAGCGLDRVSVFTTLLILNFHEKHLRKKVRELEPEVFQQVYLAVILAPDHRNIVINDFIRGAEKDFELKFNKLLLQKKAQGRAVLCLGNDIFYASEIADRVGFIKDGRLLFEAPADDLKEMDVKDLYLKFLD
jgi:ABC-type multidrug transport system ATPase subunit